MLPPVITFPDPVMLALPYLRTLLADTYSDVYASTYTGGIIVAARVPNPRPPVLVTLRRAGGVERVNGIFDRPRIDAQIFHTSEHAAFALAAFVRAQLLAAPGRVDGISHASTFLGPTPIPDPLSGQARVLLTVTWQIRGIQEA